MNHGYSICQRFRRTSEPHDLAIQMQSALVGFNDAKQDLEQGRLARPIFSNEGMDLRRNTASGLTS